MTGRLAPPGKKLMIHVQTLTGKMSRGIVLPKDALISELAELLQDYEGVAPHE